MEYDHRPGVKKIATIAQMVARERAWEVIEKEIEKCDLVCSNCHQYRTHVSRKTKLKPQENPPFRVGLKV